MVLVRWPTVARWVYHLDLSTWSTAFQTSQLRRSFSFLTSWSLVYDPSHPIRDVPFAVRVDSPFFLSLWIQTEMLVLRASYKVLMIGYERLGYVEDG